MTLDEAITLVRKAVKHTGTIDQRHIDLTVVPAREREEYERALAQIQLAVKEGQLSRDEMARRLTLDA